MWQLLIILLQGSVLVQDFLFEADSMEDAQNNFKEVLGLDTNIGLLFQI